MAFTDGNFERKLNEFLDLARGSCENQLCLEARVTLPQYHNNVIP